MRTDELDFGLPDELIATTPADPRDASRLLVVSRSDPDRIEDRVFRDLPDLLGRGDLLISNRSSVVPARLLGRFTETDGKVELLYLHEDPSDPERWIALVGAKRPRPGRVIGVLDRLGNDSGETIELIERCDDEAGGAWRVRPSGGGGIGILERSGHPPLPPYIRAQRKARHEEADAGDDLATYQTLFAADDAKGSVAAPTAGLHFTPRVMDALADRGVDTTSVTLHVGVGTFRPIETETLEAHEMHEEWCTLGPAREHFARGKPDRRVVGVGSTSVRTLEAYAECFEESGELPDSLSTGILIAPGHPWRWVDAMVTNFHLPRSTLLAMVAAALTREGTNEGVERVRHVYAHAVRERYRFYSYGDAMLVLP